jgi:amino acid transporter/nucleotide-binding universal stress UspA family protein
MAIRKHREGAGLNKVLGVPALFSTAYGNVGSSIYYALGVVAISALGMTPVVFMVTGLLFVMTAWSYAEATAALPEAGGSSSFARRAFNEFWSFGAGWALMLDYIVTIAISAFFVPNYLAVFWPVLKTYPYNTIGGIVTIVFLVILNVIGIKEAARLNIVLALLDLATQVLLMIVGIILLLEPRLLIDQVSLGVAPTWHQLIYGISIGTVAYTGIETVSNMAEESSDPGKQVPKAINLVLGAVLGVYAGISIVALSAMPVSYNVLPFDKALNHTIQVPVVAVSGNEPTGPFVFEDAPPPGNPTRTLPDGKTIVYDVILPAVQLKSGQWVTEELPPTGPVYKQDGQWVTKLYGSQLGSVYLEDPVQGIVQHLPDSLSWLRAVMRPWVGILAATILLIATNAGIIGASRLAYSLGQHRQIPPILGRVHPRRMTPYVAIIFFGGVACLLLIPGKPEFLADLYAFGAMISFTVAHVSVVALRYKEPSLERPWHTPLNLRLWGGRLPLTAVLGGLGTFSVWCVVVATHEFGRYVGFTWMAIGIVMYVIYRKKKGYSLTRTVEKIVLPESATKDIDYNQLLVPILGSTIADEMMVLACQLATEKQSSIDALYVIEVPMNLPLDARLTAEREKADLVLTRMAQIADSFKVKMTPVIVVARQAGHAIVEQADQRSSEVIILGAIKRRRFTERAFGGTIDYVVQHSSCEVLINLVPPEGPYAADAKKAPPMVSMETLEAERRADDEERTPPVM